MIQDGKRAPDFTLKPAGNTRNESGTLTGILERGPVVLAFFHTTCPVCQMTLPFLDRLAAGTGLQVVGISQDSAQDTRDFCREFGISRLPVLTDSRPYPATRAYAVTNVPSVFLVEADGTVSKSFAGFSKQDIEELGARAGLQVFQDSDRVPAFRPG